MVSGAKEKSEGDTRIPEGKTSEHSEMGWKITVIKANILLRSMPVLPTSAQLPILAMGHSHKHHQPEGTEAWRSKGTWPRPQSWQATERRFELKQSQCRARDYCGGSNPRTILPPALVPKEQTTLGLEDDSSSPWSTLPSNPRFQLPLQTLTPCSVHAPHLPFTVFPTVQASSWKSFTASC